MAKLLIKELAYIAYHVGHESISISGPGFKDWLRECPDEGTIWERRS